MPNSPAHLTEWTLEQLAEGALPADELPRAEDHLQRCARCSGELEAYRGLFVALSDLPRFAPSAGFADAVMARVRMAPETDPLYARMVRLIPRTRRGWAILTGAVGAPALALVALVAWVLSQPLVTATSLWQWTTLKGSELALSAAGGLAQWAVSLGVPDAVQVVYDTIAGVPTETLMAVVALLAVATPLSVWSLVRLVRTPMREVEYAN